MKKQNSTSQIGIRYKNAPLPTAMCESARGTRKRKMTEKSEPANMTSNSIIMKEPPSSNITQSHITKNKTMCDINSKRLKYNHGVQMTKKQSLSNICRYSKAYLKIPIYNRSYKASMPRPYKTPARKYVAFNSSRIMEQSMVLYRPSELSIRPSEIPIRQSEMPTILESYRNESYTLSTHLKTILSETKLDPDDFYPHARYIIDDILDVMFQGDELRIRAIYRENNNLKTYLLKIQKCYEELESTKLAAIQEIYKKVHEKDHQMSFLRSEIRRSECQVAELYYRLAEARYELEGRNVNEVYELQNQLNEKYMEISNLRSKFDTSERQSYTFRRELIMCKKYNSVLRKENTHYRSILYEHYSRLAYYSMAIAELETGHQQDQRIIESLECQLKESLEKLSIPQDDTIIHLKELVSNSNSYMFRLNREVSNLELKISAEDRRHCYEIERMKANHVKEVRTWRERNKKLVKCNANLKRMIDEKEDMSLDFSLGDESMC